jgi:microcystin-dependent protein
MGWLKCDGRILNVADYYFLFGVIGYSFGGSGTQFYLPDAEGRVSGIVGQSAWATGTGRNWQLADVSGQEFHTLTIRQMPTHNHSNVTDLSATGITVNTAGAHVHGITDPGHTHSGVPNQVSTATPGLSLTAGTGASTGSSTTGITINSAGDHTHTITDPTHNHRIKNDGGSNAHPSMQPTIFMGNMFIYCGITGNGKFPYDLRAGNIY